MVLCAVFGSGSGTFSLTSGLAPYIFRRKSQIIWLIGWYLSAVYSPRLIISATWVLSHAFGSLVFPLVTNSAYFSSQGESMA